MNERRIVAALCIAAAALAAPSLAHAQASPEAEKLFRDGKQLMKDGKLAEACAAFDASEKAEHNVATVMSLADCREKNHQYASAWALFLQADSNTRSDASKGAINAVAKKRAAALEPRLSYLTINVPDESRIEGLVITRDEIPVANGAWNRAMPVDGGEHIIAGHAPGHEEWSTKISVEPENDKKAVEVPKFKELPKLINGPDELGGLSEVSPWTPRREIAAYVGGGGILVGAVGIGFGINASGLRHDALATCPPSACNAANAAAANALNDKARRRALYANIGFGVAGAAIIAAGILWFTGAPDEEAPPPGAAPGTPPKPTDETALHIVPVFGETNGFVLTRNF
jgi:hypothetical protein